MLLTVGQTQQFLTECNHFPTPHKRLRLIHLLYPYLHCLVDSLFLDARHHGSLLQGLHMVRCPSCRTTPVAHPPIIGFHHLNHSMQNLHLAISCFPAHSDNQRNIRLRLMRSLLATGKVALCCVVLGCQPTRLRQRGVKASIMFQNSSFDIAFAM
jgi:hypothetical protein